MSWNTGWSPSVCTLIAALALLFQDLVHFAPVERAPGIRAFQTRRAGMETPGLARQGFTGEDRPGNIEEKRLVEAVHVVGRLAFKARVPGPVEAPLFGEGGDAVDIRRRQRRRSPRATRAALDRRGTGPGAAAPGSRAAIAPVSYSPLRSAAVHARYGCCTKAAL